MRDRSSNDELIWWMIGFVVLVPWATLNYVVLAGVLL